MRLTSPRHRTEKDPVSDDSREPDADAASGVGPDAEVAPASPEAASVPPSDDEKPGGATASRGGSRLLWAGLALAIVLGVTGGLAWWSAAHDEEAELSRDRDAALVAAKQNIATLNTLDYRSVGKGIDAWMDVTTGTLHDQFAAVSEEDQKLLADQKKVSTGKVVGAAVLDVDARTARVIASVEVTVADGDDLSAEPAVKRNRFSADLEKVDGRWLLTSLEQVAVDLS